MSETFSPTDNGEFTIRTERHMTITEAHPFHGMTPTGRQSLDRGGSTYVWKKHDPNCPKCREEQQDHEDAAELYDETRGALLSQAPDNEEHTLP
jgi:hypothetical protein